jgi:hypothetical protein
VLAEEAKSQWGFSDADISLVTIIEICQPESSATTEMDVQCASGSLSSDTAGYYEFYTLLFQSG